VNNVPGLFLLNTKQTQNKLLEKYSFKAERENSIAVVQVIKDTCNDTQGLVRGSGVKGQPSLLDV